MSQNTKRRLSRYFFISLVLHLFAFLILWLEKESSQNRQPKTVEIEFVDSEDKLVKAPLMPDDKAQQIVQQDQRINDEKDPKAKYLSQFDQSVRQETRAEDSGKYNNSAGLGGETKKTNAKPGDAKKVGQEAAKKKAPTEKQAKQDSSPDGVLPKLNDLKPSLDFNKMAESQKKFEEDTGPNGGSGPKSATADYLKDVKPGVQTLLSTREFIYYSYYNRIKEKLHQYWEPKIKEKVTRLIRSGRTIASNQDRITKIVIILNDKGKLLKVQVLSASGVRDLDEAAIEAFEAAAPFPNPPKGIVEADGTIKIRWDFVIEA